MSRGTAALTVVLAALLASHAVPAAAEAPARVVSINLCTDQLAMLLAAPGQLVSVSDLSREPRSSAMAQQALDYPINHAGAEEIWLLQPDLVLAGSYTSRATVSMLRRLGREVVEVRPAYSLDDIRDRITQVGAALGRDAAAADLIADFDARLDALRVQTTRNPTAAIYYANGYTTGDRTLAGQILMAAGFENIAGDMGGGHLPLERLVMARPEALITGSPYPGASRSEEILRHPAVAALRDQSALRVVADRDWLCGTPHVLKAVAALAEFRKQVP
ncbi:Vitamin B12-binding protein [Pseudooceanicola algae]|uniref:Vitamin B12-binding protein n=1 Tax=Pseudooceanicola algae TaxID=1537215 RepID=A0A418SIS3_9RHOB|nr:ABC transporter substrate-binding protein [Pseudooceanicola algae]QPM91206.1 Vitamin B12-binding protein [Pseudooceanicola algae]